MAKKQRKKLNFQAVLINWIPQLAREEGQAELKSRRLWRREINYYFIINFVLNLLPCINLTIKYCSSLACMVCLFVFSL